MWFQIILGHMEVPPCFCSSFSTMLSSFFFFIFLCTVDMVHYLPPLTQVFCICLVMYGSLPSSGVTDGVWKSLGIALYGYSFGRLVVSPPPIPSSLVVSKNGIAPSASSACVNLMLFVSSTLFRWLVRCCVICLYHF